MRSNPRDSQPHRPLRSKTAQVNTLTLFSCGTPSIVGRYRSATTGTDASIGDGMLLRTTGRFGSAEFGLERIGANIWQAALNGVMPSGGILTFDEDRAGFAFSSSRTHALPFTRSDPDPSRL